MKFRKRPVIVDAEQFRPEVDAPWPDGVAKDDYGYFVFYNSGYCYELFPGDWVVRYSSTSIEVVTDSDFRTTYEPIKEEPNGR